MDFGDAGPDSICVDVPGQNFVEKLHDLPDADWLAPRVDRKICMKQSMDDQQRGFSPLGVA